MTGDRKRYPKSCMATAIEVRIYAKNVRSSAKWSRLLFCGTVKQTLFAQNR